MTEPTVITLGCRLNAHESEAVAAHARAAGLSDWVIVNTCAVTTESVRQAAQTIRRVKRERPGARLMVTGCAAQLDAGRFAAMPGVDAVLGNREKLDPQAFIDIARSNAMRVRVGDLVAPHGFEAPVPVVPAARRTRATLAIQNGCDHRCTFCIIPIARGPARSMSEADVVARTRQLVAAGHREVVLTGVDLTSWGTDLTGRPALGQVVRAILRHVPELDRLRLSSIDPAEADDDLVAALGSEPRLMPHLHLSMQAGDDLVLKRMKRRHTRTDAIRFASRVRAARPDVVLGADLIAGFPTETDAMFAATLDAIASCGLTYLHIFPYSSRPDTPAARMPQVPGQIVMARAARLRQEGRDRLAAFLDAEVGSVRRVLMERGGVGRTPQFAEVVVRPAPEPGVIIDVRIIGHDGTRLVGDSVPGRVREAPAPVRADGSKVTA